MAANGDEGQCKQVELDRPPFFSVYTDGSIKRHPNPDVPPSPHAPDSYGVLSKDVTLDPQLGLWARLFLPPAPAVAPAADARLPVVLFFHGGCFVIGSPSWIIFHSFCAAMAKNTSSICVSASYRLAPEHRLPAAYDDSFKALQWLQAQADAVEGEGEPWLTTKADFSRCFLAGISAGSNIAYQLALRITQQQASFWQPLSFKGLLLIHPAFVREHRTRQEESCPQDYSMNWRLADVYFKLNLPSGTNKDHPFVNPLSETSSVLGRLSSFGKVMVALADGDGLHYMGLEFCQALKEAGCHNVELEISEGGGHAFFLAQPESHQARCLMNRIFSFIESAN